MRLVLRSVLFSILLVLVAVFAQAATEPAKTQAPFLEAYPKLGQMLYKEKHSGFYLGFGASPLGILNARQMFTANFFQVHYMTDRWDLELLNTSLGYVHSQASAFSSTNFMFRAAPKYRFGSVLSVGPLFGWEWVSFPNIPSKLYKDTASGPKVTPFSEPFSSNGPIYGAIASETFRWGESYLVQFNQLVFQETYATDKTRENWTYLFINNPDLTADRGPIKPSMVIMLEVSFLY